MTGTIALHGGGEFLPGDEPFLDELVRRAVAGRGEAGVGDAPLRVVVVPTAAARGRPDLAGATGVAALERAAVRVGVTADVTVVPVLDPASAGDPGLAGRIGSADLIHLPGGDPDLLPAILTGSRALAALREALERGACVAGASAGAMAMADPCWTPAGLVPGFGLVSAVLVVPHTDGATWAARRARFAAERPAGAGLLGLAERTGVLGQPGGNGGHGGRGVRWSVVGAGEARWLPADRPVTDEPLVAAAGASLRLA